MNQKSGDNKVTINISQDALEAAIYAIGTYELDFCDMQDDELNCMWDEYEELMDTRDKLINLGIWKYDDEC